MTVGLCRACGLLTPGLYCDGCRATARTPMQRRRLASKVPKLEVSARWDGDRLLVVLPLPSVKLHPNARGGWQEAGRLTKARRRAVCLAVRSAGRREPLEQAEARAVFYYAVQRVRDQDGAAAWLKATWDGIADAGVIQNDAGFTHLPPRLEIDRDNPRVELEIRPLPRLSEEG